MFGFGRKKKQQAHIEAKAPESFFSTHHPRNHDSVNRAAAILEVAYANRPKTEGENGAMDAASYPNMGALSQVEAISDQLSNWYASQSFIGWQMSAVLAQNWLIEKACAMPARDASRNGYEIVTTDGEDLNDEDSAVLKKYDRLYKSRWNCEQFVRMGRIFGIRIAIFKVDSTDTDYYENPFNPDGITPGSYKGISQIDPYWCAPILDAISTSDPSSLHFYEPTYWIIAGKKYHRSHLCIFRTAEPPDILKPMYLYGGVPVPQRIMERVYAAERVANEAPLLATSKRTTVWQTNMAAFKAAGENAVQSIKDWVNYRDNFGVKIGDKDADEFQQFETSLSDLDEVIMTQYQLVAAGAEVPATKLLGTSPKGFNATGEYEESSYHESLESIQTHDLTPLMERHHLCVLRSFGSGKNAPETTVTWNPLDAPTSKEVAEVNLAKAQAGAALIQSGALMPEDERRRVATDPESGYSQLGIDDDDDDPEVLADLGLSDATKNAAKELGLGGD